MHHAIAALAKAGNNVVADHVLVERAWVDECAQLFGDLPAFLIGVFCPLEVLEQREKARRNRTWGQARAQFSIVHAHTVYDLEVDTGAFSPEACAQQIVARLADDLPPHAWRQLRERAIRNGGGDLRWSVLGTNNTILNLTCITSCILLRAREDELRYKSEGDRSYSRSNPQGRTGKR
jgi:hypothetical protein